MSEENVDPKAVALLSGNRHERLALKVLAAMIAYPKRRIEDIGRWFGASRQDVYRALRIAKMAGYAAEVDSVARRVRREGPSP